MGGKNVPYSGHPKKKIEEKHEKWIAKGAQTSLCCVRMNSILDITDDVEGWLIRHFKVHTNNAEGAHVKNHVRQQFQK